MSASTWPKHELAVHLHPQRVDWTFGNDAAGWEALHGALAAACTGVVTVAYEPTGGYERGMVRHLRGVGYRLRPVVSLRVRQFARSQGWLANAWMPGRSRSMRLHRPVARPRRWPERPRRSLGS